MDEFLDYSPLNRLRYSVIFAMTLKSILVYMADIGILIIMITAFNDLARILNGETKDCLYFPLLIALFQVTSSALDVQFAPRNPLVWTATLSPPSYPSPPVWALYLHPCSFRSFCSLLNGERDDALYDPEISHMH